MSVVVRMEMPEGCWCCPFGHYDWIWGDDGREKMVCFCCLDLESEEDGHYLLETEQKRPSWCPILCQLPEGHGRLVDARSLFDEVYEYYGQDNESNENWMMDMINCSPTIVPADGESPSPKPTDPLPIRGVEYVPTEVDVQTGTVTYELRERSEEK